MCDVYMTHDYRHILPMRPATRTIATETIATETIATRISTNKATNYMSDLSIADIQAARNQKVAVESNETERIAAELEGAHQDALALKERLREQEGEASVPQQQVGYPMLHPPSSSPSPPPPSFPPCASVCGGRARPNFKWAESWAEVHAFVQ